MKDYYQILGVSPDATEDQIRKVYRRQALQHHPDRNPGDPDAEERFKEIAEAYGVLIDPAKRREYDQWRRGARVREEAAREGFPFSRQQVFEDLFRDPRFNQVFQELFREFDRAGFRFDQRFFNQVFFGGRGVRMGGFFFWGPVGMRPGRAMPRRSSTFSLLRPSPQRMPSLLRSAGIVRCRTPM